MDEQKKEYFDEIADRSITAKSAHSKGKKVKAPFNDYTKRQADKKNGPAKAYNLGAPMVWTAFCNMPDDLKREYILRCYDNGGTNSHIGRMFGVSYATVRVVCKRLGINIAKRNFERTRWKAWLDTAEKETEPTTSVTPATTPETTLAPAIDVRDDASGQITLTGSFNEIRPILEGLLGSSRKRITVIFEPERKSTDESE